MDTIFFLVQQTWFFAIPLLVVALGGLFSERSGVINIALEGIMLIGALCGIGFIHIFNHAMPPQLLLLCAVLVAGAAGIVFSLFHAFHQRYGTEYLCTCILYLHRTNLPADTADSV